MSLLSEHRGFVAVFPGGNVGVFGARGFTRLPAVAATLDPYECSDPDADVVEFEGMPRVDAVRLLALLPKNQADVAVAGGPSFARLLSLTRRCATARFDGARVSARRFDERIVLHTLTIGGADITTARRRRIAALAPTELTYQSGTLVARW